MILFSRVPKCFSTIRCLSTVAQASSSSVNKEALMNLRKRTGYSYVNCRKALVQFGPDKLDEAEQWLKELAKKEGWAKAAKLSSRATSQGLVGVTASGQYASVIELTCETDFVARGDSFKLLLEQLTLSALNHTKNVVRPGDSRITVRVLSIDDLKTENGQAVKEVLTMAVGKLGENITIKKAEGFCAPTQSSLYCSAHPKDGTDVVQMGKFASIVALSRDTAEGLFPTDKLAAQICQHIIGMRSESLGEPPKEATIVHASSVNSLPSDELNDFDQTKTTEIDEEETALLRQSFMLNPSQSVYDYVAGHRAKIVDFVRTELGGSQE